MNNEAEIFAQIRLATTISLITYGIQLLYNIQVKEIQENLKVIIVGIHFAIEVAWCLLLVLGKVS